jgi:quercetin dioxygenase-like cupin family protein
MPSMEPPSDSAVVVLDLDNERRIAEDPATLEQSGRSSRSLLKNGPLRVTLITLAAGGQLEEHEAQGPITIQPLAGRLRFTARGKDHDIGPGDLLSVATGIRHAVASAGGATFLLTLARP